MAAVTAYLGAFAWSMQHATYDVWGAFVVAPVILLTSVGHLTRTADRIGDPAMGPVLVLALVLKLLGAIVVVAVAAEVYDGAADATFYHEQGRIVAESLRDGSFDIDVGEGYRIVGTGFVVVLTGIVYAVIGATRLGGALVFAWLGFCGLMLFHSAFCTAVPDGRRRRYAVLLFFLPSMLFWSSTVGKEAWMTFTLGLVALGVARLLVSRRGGVIAIGLGLAGSAMVRPHVTLLILAALTVAFLLRRPRYGGWGFPSKVAGLVVLVAVSVLLVGQTERFFGVKKLDRATAAQVLANTTHNSTYGGSTYETGTLGRPGELPSPLDLPRSLVTVLFRPFPNEAHNVQSLAASLEGIVLLGLFAFAARSLIRIPRLAVRIPYVTFAAVFIALASLALATFGNFGLLARERVQVLPFAIVLLALPPLALRIARPGGEPGWKAPPIPTPGAPAGADFTQRGGCASGWQEGHHHTSRGGAPTRAVATGVRQR